MKAEVKRQSERARSPKRGTVAHTAQSVYHIRTDVRTKDDEPFKGQSACRRRGSRNIPACEGIAPPHSVLLSLPPSLFPSGSFQVALPCPERLLLPPSILKGIGLLA